MRRLIFLGIGLCHGCAAGGAGDTTFGPATVSTTATNPTTVGSSTGDETDGDASSGGSTSSDASSSGGSGSGATSDTTATTTSGGSTGQSTFTTGGSTSTTGDQPDSGAWSPCTMANPTCDAGLTCLGPTVGNEGYCAPACMPAGDASSCPASPGGTAVPICLNVQGSSPCALDCSAGKTCPGGMTCTMDTDDAGAIEICF